MERRRKMGRKEGKKKRRGGRERERKERERKVQNKEKEKGEKEGKRENIRLRFVPLILCFEIYMLSVEYWSSFPNS